MTEAMLGTTVVPADKTQQMYTELLEIEKTVAHLGPEAIQWFGEAKCLDWDVLKVAFEGIKKAMELARQFPRVERDEKVVRKVRPSNSQSVEIEVPLVFHAKLPLQKTIQFQRTIGQHRYKCSTRVPNPTPEAIAALKSHADKFDAVELWWVPNDILVEKIPDPDPMLVGVVTITPSKHLYFELKRKGRRR